MTGMVIRNGYIKELDKSRHQDAVKVLIGMRRVGKSTILRQFADHLRNDGIDNDDIIYIDMESLQNVEYTDGVALYRKIMSMPKGKRKYILLDEVQLIDGWERVVNSIRIDIDCDMYISGSNAYLLSSDISTLITGRSIPITVLPMSLPEYIQLGMGNGPDDAFLTYSKYGGLPMMRPDLTAEMIVHRIESIKSDIILKDICNRKKVDSIRIRKVIDYLFSEIGNKISIDTISEVLDMSTSTVSDYLNLITDSMMFMKAERYDLKGRNILKSTPKYYCTDLGMRASQPISIDNDFGRKLENIVYLELVRKGKRVYIGNIGNLEVDFVTIGEDTMDYYQVTKTLEDPKVMERELAPFRQLTGRGERYLITYDDVPRTETQDAVIINIKEFLMEYSEDLGKTPMTEDNGAYMKAYGHLDAYLRLCSEILHTVVTIDNVSELSDRLQNTFFDMQSAFKHPLLIGDRFIQERFDSITRVEVNIFNAMIACANSNGHTGTYKPVSIGSMEILTKIRDEVSHHIGHSVIEGESS